MSERRDYAFEALAEVTATDWNEGRGQLNAALRSIREQAPELEDSFLLADEIHARAAMYREVMPEVVLTAPALAKNWLRVKEEAARLNEQRAEKARASRKETNTHAPDVSCTTCGGDRMVLIGLQASQASAWMQERGIEARGFSEVLAPCPDCNADADTHFARPDGSIARTLDPGTVRMRMRQ